MSMVPCAAPSLLLTRRPRQSFPCADLAFPLTGQPRQSFPCADLAFLLTRQPRQSLPCAAPALPLTRQPRQSLPCAAPALLLTRQPRQSHPVRSPGPSRSRDSLGSPLPYAAPVLLLTRRIKIRPSYVRGSLLRTGGLWNPFLSPGRIAGHSRVALWPYCHLHEEFRLCWQTEIGADELDF